MDPALGVNPPSSGDTFTAAFGVEGALTCRAGAVTRAPGDLPDDVRAFYDRFVRNYFAVVARWYEQVRVGATADAVVAQVEGLRDHRLLQFAVNPGHLIHLDEWMHSPFTEGSQDELHSGMALQMDIIPVSQGLFCYANAEDGVILADETLRSELAEQYPDLWSRVLARRHFMDQALGISLDESVLPLSNMGITWLVLLLSGYVWNTRYAGTPDHPLHHCHDLRRESPGRYRQGHGQSDSRLQRRDSDDARR